MISRTRWVLGGLCFWVVTPILAVAAMCLYMCLRAIGVRMEDMK